MKKQFIFKQPFRFKNKGFVMALFALALVALSLSGCGNGGNSASTSNGSTNAAADTGGEAEKTYYDIKLPDSAGTGINLFYLADELGYFEEFGINPIFVGEVAVGSTVPSVLSGGINVSGNHVNRLIAAIASGAKVKAVVAVSETTEEIPHMKFLTLEDSGIYTAEDIVGKRIGVTAIGGCNEYTTYEYLRKELGIEDPRESINYVILPAGTEETTLRTGEVDIVGMHGDPIAVIERGGVRVLYSDYEVWGNDGGATPYWFATDFIEKNPEAVHGFVQAVVKTGNWLNEHPQEAREIQGPRVNLEPKELYHQHFTPDGVIRPETIEIWNDILLHYGEISEAVPPDQVYTNEFNDLAS
ncbi:MAG: ABC transporter substrate-binding protein [Clostridiales Family XIII bacterium]|jgi:ABC-type nitrate/sulfonate/bicarbonate transport system substrate-binding protein|nr:ABC transporter substrate-binding protein [Clostridiales Family XIII bacterium]